MNKQERLTIMKAMLKEQDNLMCGGIFSKEEYYANKYNVSTEEISDIWVFLFYAVEGDTIKWENGWTVKTRE